MRLFNYRLLIGAAACLVAVSVAPSACAFTPCDVTYLFMGKTMGDTCTLAYQTIRAGECEAWTITYLTLGPQGLLASKQKSLSPSPRLPIWDTSLVFGDSLDSIYSLWPTGDGFVCNLTSVSVQAPPYDTTDLEYKRDSANIHFSSEFCASHFAPPRVNHKCSLVWREPNGLYVNYRIAEVLLTGEYLFIRTQGPSDPRNAELYNGLLIYRIE